MNIKKILLIQPNYSMFGKRSWKMFPYSLGIINACIRYHYETRILDPNFDNLEDKKIIELLRDFDPQLVGLSTGSTEYIQNTTHMVTLIREALPDTIIVEGGVAPTVALDTIIQDRRVDYWIVGEAEFTFPKFIEELNKPNPNLSQINGLVYYDDKGMLKINPMARLTENLDFVPFADYGNLTWEDYASQKLRYAQGLCARKNPYAVTITSRGCPYRCVFCSGSRVSGKKVRMRSAENVLSEVDKLHMKGIKEIIFLDDHFLFDRNRAISIMKGLIERKYDLVWKCANLTVFMLDEEVLNLMKESGSYQLTISIESGNQYVLNNIIKKPVNLEKVPAIVNMAKMKGFEIIANFVIGFPDETWDQIRDTFAYAEKLNVDLVNFHIATPLPGTELTETCIKKGYLPPDFNKRLVNVGYTEGVISTEEFTPQDLRILRAFEWDRINFRSKERKEAIARIQGISIGELEQWRKDTRLKLGVKVVL